MHTTTSPQARSSFSRMTHSFERPPMTLVTCTPLSGRRADDGQEHRGADAAADAHGVAGRDEIGLAAEGTGDVLDRLADLEGRELGRAGADGLDHEGDGPGLGIVVGDRQRDPLPARSLADDDELAGTPDLRDPGSLDDEADDVRGELLALDDGMQVDLAGMSGAGRIIAHCQTICAGSRMRERGRYPPLASRCGPKVTWDGGRSGVEGLSSRLGRLECRRLRRARRRQPTAERSFAAGAPSDPRRATRRLRGGVALQAPDTTARVPSDRDASGGRRLAVNPGRAVAARSGARRAGPRARPRRAPGAGPCGGTRPARACGTSGRCRRGRRPRGEPVPASRTRRP